MSENKENTNSSHESDFSGYAVHFLSETGWKGFKVEDIQDFTGRALLARNRISDLEAKCKKQEEALKKIYLSAQTWEGDSMNKFYRCFEIAAEGLKP